MNRPLGRTDYEESLGRVTSHIYDHLDEPLDLNRLAEAAHLSPYRWHRSHRTFTGETISQAVRRLRLLRTTSRLVRTAHSVKDVAARSGYGSQAAFNRDFKAAYGLSPAEYRKKGSHGRLGTEHEHGAISLREVDVRTIGPTAVLAVEHRGSYLAIGVSFDVLLGRLREQSLLDSSKSTFGLYDDDPAIVPPGELRS